MNSTRNQKATVLTLGLDILAVALLLWGALIQPETRISGTIGTSKIDIPAWMQNEPEYHQKIKNAKVDQGWGGARLLMWGLALFPLGLGVALTGERRGELDDERKVYDRAQLEKEQLGKVQTAYNVGLAAALLQKTGEAKIAVHEESLVEEVQGIYEANGWYAPEPVKAIEPPILKEPEAPTINPFEGMKTPEQYAAELAAAKDGALDRLKADGDQNPGDGVPDDRVKFYQAKGKKLITSLARLRMSILSAAPTGAGKSTTMDQWLAEQKLLFPQGENYVIAQKNDSFMGLAEQGRVTQFNAFSAEASFKFLDVVYAEMKRRLAEPKADRAKYDFIPVRLILDDWHATYTALKLDPNLCRIVTTKLGQIITLGREANVCLYIATQSYNLVTLGLVEDSGIRSNLAITCQGLVKQTVDESGEMAEQGDYTVLQQLIKNQFIIPSNADRERLMAELNELIELSMKHQVPATFSAIGTASLGLMPYYEIGASENNSTSTNVAVIDRKDDELTPEQIENQRLRWELEWNLDASSNHISQPEDVSPNNDSTGVSGSGEVIDTGSSEENDTSVGNKNWETNSWYKWLPSKADVLKLLEDTDANFYTLAYIVRSKLKKTDAEYNRKAKSAIVQMLLDLDRIDLIEKYQINPKDYPLL